MEEKCLGENNKICRQVFFLYLLDRDIFLFQSYHSCNHNNNRSGDRQHLLFGPVLSKKEGEVGNESGHWIQASGHVFT